MTLFVIIQTYLSIYGPHQVYSLDNVIFGWVFRHTGGPQWTMFTLLLSSVNFCLQELHPGYKTSVLIFKRLFCRLETLTIVLTVSGHRDANVSGNASYCLYISIFRVITLCEDETAGDISTAAISTFAWTSWSATIQRLEMSEISDFEDSDNSLFFFNLLKLAGNVNSLFLQVVDLTGVDVAYITTNS